MRRRPRRRLPEHPHGAEIKAEQVRLLYRQLPAGLFGSVVLGCLAAFVLWQQVPRALLLAWLFVLALLTLGRVWLMRRYFQIDPPPDEAPSWGHAFVFAAGLAGVLWGMAGMFPFREPSLLHEVFLAFMIAGLAAGAMTTMSSFRGAYLAFLLPAILPLAVRLMLHLTEAYVVMSGMLTLFAILMAVISRRLYLSLLESLHLRFDNVGLVNELAAARDRQQVALDELEAEMRGEAHGWLCRPATSSIEPSSTPPAPATTSGREGASSMPIANTSVSPDTAPSRRSRDAR